MRIILLLIILIFSNSCNMDQGVQKSYIISEAQDDEIEQLEDE